jgi:type 1 glutamine amidotransferase
MLKHLALVILALAAGAAADAAEPLKALFVTGGGYHDYHKLTPILTAGMAKHANATFDVKMCDKPEQLIDLLKDPKLGEGYDVIVYDMCHADIYGDDWIANAKRVTKEGKPTLMVHCAMHCFWKGRKDSTWGECCGLYTNYHEKYAPFAVTATEPKGAIVKFWPESFKTEGDELYHNVKFPFPDADSSVALLSAKDPKGVDQVVAWTHLFGKGKVFGTTLGHDTKTAETDEYHHLLANGLLWVTGKLGDDGQPLAGYAGK